MVHVNNAIQKEIEEAQKEYEEEMKELQSEIAEAGSISTTEMHIFNIAFAVVMIIIGAVLVYQTRGVQLKNGKKIAGWILLILGIITVIAHVVQLIL